ncbi:flagellar hook-associated family protein [Rhizobium sp. LjRoot98]|uniref:flagellar hook-associated family protein n=1 Tax=unclassified Rhizobium TaxID=2613769 RepID=UPI0007131E29|nr:MULTISPECIES: flagellar hook-associated family protein [unclassified Rhizobium]KQV33989.1 flagellar biosynthesis protein FlgL [Rhizobium sp. Root1204]KQY17715.1 flagellar biosynthesis protein FlgL [Rhizobium sp. Root1334]KRC13582.1 flagellar biosynthesis protein FlgL [Rhizobium sp. Root73]
MKTSFVSNLAVQNAMRLTIQRGQVEMMKLNDEVSTGVHADYGLALGASTSKSVNISSQLDRLATLKSTNSIVTQRLAGSQEALKTMQDAAQKSLSSLMAFRDNSTADLLKIAQDQNAAAMTTFTSAANTSLNGEYLFSGINTDVQPFTEYTPTSAAKASYDAALSTFIAAQPVQVPPLNSVNQFTKAQMTDFIDNSLAPMYADPSVAGSKWTDWSDASSQNMTSRISANEVIQSSANLNAEGARKFALASLISTELLSVGLSDDVRGAVTGKAIEFMGEAVTGLISMQSNLGLSQERVKKANTSIEAQTKIIKANQLDLEGIDTFAASTMLKTLQSQLETSYTLTARLQQLSLINFL